MHSSIYENNIEAMRPRFSNVIEYLERSSDEKKLLDEEKDLVAGIQEVCGKTVLYAQKGDKMYQLDSLYDSSVLENVWFDSLGDEWDLDARLMMYGIGNGMLVRKFIQSTRSDCCIVVHEPSEIILKAALENFDFTDLFSDTRIRFVFWPLYRDSDDIKHFYHKEVFDYKGLGSHKFSFYPNYPRLFDFDSSCYISEIESARDTVYADQVVHDRFGEDYNRNTFSNLPLIPRSLSYEDLIEAMPDDIPAVIVAAGPSLDKNIEDLKAAKGKCLIISTDTALKPLALAGIEPDLAAIMDGKKDARYLSEESSRNVPLFCTPRSGNTFMSLHKGEKFFTDYYCDHVKSFMDKEGCCFIHLPTGGSVANSCFGIAESLHCKRIILVGQDLAYTGDKTHSAVTVRGAKKTAVEDLEHPVMGVDINGDPVRTSLEFKIYKEWFEHEILTHPELSVIDATEGGIRIEGTTLMTLKEAIAKECTSDFDFRKVLSKVGKLLPDEKEKKYMEYIRRIPVQIRELKGMVGAALDGYVRMEKLVRADDYHSSKFAKLYKDSINASDKIENSPVIEYVQYQMQDRSTKMLEKVNKLEKDEKQELLAACDLGRKYLNDMLESISELEGILNECGYEAALQRSEKG